MTATIWPRSLRPVLPALERMPVQTAIEWRTGLLGVVDALADELAAVERAAGGTVAVSVAARRLWKQSRASLMRS